MLFGLTQSHNHGGDKYNESMYIFHMILDPTTKDAKNAGGCQLEHKKIKIDKGKSMWAGMKKTMNYDSSNSKYYIHAIYQEEAKRDFYIRASPSSTDSSI